MLAVVQERQHVLFGEYLIISSSLLLKQRFILFFDRFLAGYLLRLLDRQDFALQFLLFSFSYLRIYICCL